MIVARTAGAIGAGLVLLSILAAIIRAALEPEENGE